MYHELLDEQLRNVLALFQYDKYTVCLTPEAVDISYEIRASEVRIRTDRRNKGQPRVGRISGVVLSDPGMAAMFEREFWTTFRLTEPEFKDKVNIAEWLKERVRNYKGFPDVAADAGIYDFDVFLCHNSSDKGEVRAIAKRLRARRIRTWLDEDNLIPGRSWQRALEAQIKTIRSAAVCVGANGLGPWTNFELDAFLREFVDRGCPVIPVILASATVTPELPVFLKGMHWVDFRKSKPDPLQQLVSGITGRLLTAGRRRKRSSK